MPTAMIEADLHLQKPGFKLEARFSVPSKGVTGVFGHSGCGKTSLLRCIAGLEPESQGSFTVGERRWQGGNEFTPTLQRRVGVVFQEPSLFPHLSVEGNLVYGRNRTTKNSQLIDIEHIIELLDLQDLRHRGVMNLSGGERQRVAIGRALMSSPSLLLLDEPLSALDHNARKALMDFLDSVFQELEIPAFYISHSTEEIARLADSLILMEAGRVTAFGDMYEVLGRVDSPLNAANEAFSVLDCEVQSHELPHLTTVRSKGGRVLHIPRLDNSSQRRLRLRIRARDVSLCLARPDNSSILNILEAEVVDISSAIDGGSRTVKLDISGDKLLARVSVYSSQKLKLAKGLSLFAQIKSAALIG